MLAASHDYREIGTLLYSARQTAHLTLDEVAHRLHIRARYLSALEEGRFTELPGVTYIKGYLQSYAHFLGLDKEEIIRRFEQMEDVLTRKNFYFPQVLRKQKTPSPRFIWGGLIAALAIYVFWLVAMQPHHSAISMVEPFTPRIQPKKPVLAQDAACLGPQEALYPPCTAVRNPGFSLPRGQMHSIMELADNYPGL